MIKEVEGIDWECHDGKFKKIQLATEPTYNNLTRINAITGKVELSGFGKEYKYLRTNGYVFDSVSKSMIKK